MPGAGPGREDIDREREELRGRSLAGRVGFVSGSGDSTLGRARGGLSPCCVTRPGRSVSVTDRLGAAPYTDHGEQGTQQA